MIFSPEGTRPLGLMQTATIAKHAALARRILTPNVRRPLGARDVLLVCHDNDRGYRYRLRAYAQFLDTLGDELEQLGYSVGSLATPTSLLSGEKTHRDALPTYRVLRAIAKSRLSRSVGGRDSEGDPVVRAWGRTLEGIKPRVIVGIQPAPELCIAAKKHGTQVFDLQHGVINGKESDYYSESGRRKWNQDGWPDAILCWDDDSATYVRNELNRHTRSIVVGNPWMRRFSESQADDRLVAVAQDAFSRAVDVDRPIVLVSLQWGTGDDHEAGFGELRPLKPWIRRRQDVLWAVRAHPVLYRRSRGSILHSIDQQFVGSANVLPAATVYETPLPLLLSCTVGHVTATSSVCKEAAQVGVPSLCFTNESEIVASLFPEEVRMGAVSCGNDVDRLDSWLDGVVDNATSIWGSNPGGRRDSFSGQSCGRPDWIRVLGLEIP